MVDLSYPALLDLFPEYRVTGRAESAAFLMWYLEHYYRLDALEAIDCVCDQPGDRGVDGIYVNDADQTITIFQSKISQNGKSIGDKPIREFAGCLAQFKDRSDIEEIIASGGDSRLVKLLHRLNLIDKIDDYEVRGEFIINSETDSNGLSFLQTCPNIDFIGSNNLVDSFISDSRDIAKNSPATLSTLGFDVSEYAVDKVTKALIVPVLARELVNLGGISDQSVFAYNVRGPLGRTGVNKDIVKSIKDAQKHKLFPLFHNGITVIAGGIEKLDNQLKISDYFVVNGCQSLTALYNNRSFLTDDLRVLAKFIQLDPSSKAAEEITRYSNNQNGVKARDFKSNHPHQIRLQNEFNSNYPKQFAYEIKTGESLPEGEKVTNEDAGLMLMAFDLKEPWATHRRYEVWEEKHTQLFARPEVTADHIVLILTASQVVSEKLATIENELVRKYVLTKFMLLYISRLVIESEVPDLLKNPMNWVRKVGSREKLKQALGKMVNDLAIDLNFEFQGLGQDFDYRGSLRDKEWVQKTAQTVFASRAKDISRGKVDRFDKVLSETET